MILLSQPFSLSVCLWHEPCYILSSSAAVTSVVGTVCTSTSWSDLVLFCLSVFGQFYLIIPNHDVPFWSLSAQGLFTEETEGQVGCFVPDLGRCSQQLVFLA